MVEPYLLKIGFVVRTPTGRRVTREAYQHLGHRPPAPAGQAGCLCRVIVSDVGKMLVAFGLLIVLVAWFCSCSTRAGAVDRPAARRHPHPARELQLSISRS